MKCRNWITAFILTMVIALPPAAEARKRHPQVVGAEGLIQRAWDLSDIRRAGSLPFHLHAKFHFADPSGKAIEGTYTLDWASPIMWRAQLDTPDFHDTEIGGSGKLWLLRNTKYKPLVAFLVDSTVNFFNGGSKSRPGQDLMLLQPEEGTKTICLLERLNQWTRFKMCFDKDSGALVEREQSNYTPHIRHVGTVFEFRNYQALGPRELFPWEINLSSNGVEMIHVDIDALSMLNEIPLSLFTPPTGARERPACQSPDPPRLIKSVKPAYPESARKLRLQGDVFATVYLGADGNVQDVELLRSPSPVFDPVVVSTIKNEWKFEPASCNGQPIPADVLTEISY
jgi:TonB family protein